MKVQNINDTFLNNNYIYLFKKSNVKCDYVGYNKVFKRHNYKVVVVFESKQYTFNFYKSGERGPSHYEIIDYLMSNALRMSKIPNIESYIKELEKSFHGNNNSFEYNELMFKIFHKDFLNTVRLFGEFKIINYKKCVDFVYNGYNYLMVDKVLLPYKESLTNHNIKPVLVICSHCREEYYTSFYNRDAFCSECTSEFRR